MDNWAGNGGSSTTLVSINNSDMSHDTEHTCDNSYITLPKNRWSAYETEVLSEYWFYIPVPFLTTYVENALSLVIRLFYLVDLMRASRGHRVSPWQRSCHLVVPQGNVTPLPADAENMRGTGNGEWSWGVSKTKEKIEPENKKNILSSGLHWNGWTHGPCKTSNLDPRALQDVLFTHGTGPVVQQPRLNAGPVEEVARERERRSGLQ